MSCALQVVGHAAIQNAKQRVGYRCVTQPRSFRVVASLGIRRPYAGYRSARKQVASELVPQSGNKPRFDIP